jgi:hypothetical protein
MTEANVVSQTIDEALGGIGRDRALRRLTDWRDRVHSLYDKIEQGLGSEYSYDRSGKHRSLEEMSQRAGLQETEVPEIDILRIEKPAGTLRALVQPRHLWIIGANGRLDLIIPEKQGRGRLFLLVDTSKPLSGAVDWRVASPTDRMHQSPFTVSYLQGLLH